MIIEEILKQLTPERVKKEIEAVQKTKLPLEIQKWAKEYERAGGERNEFIWRWLYKVFQEFRLPIVSKKYQKSLLKTKILLTMFIVQLDDIADQKQRWKLLNELLKIPLEQNYIKITHLNYTEKKYLIFTQKIWNNIKKQIKKYPHYKELEEIFRFDISQVLNVMEYSYLVNKNPHLINKTESWLYLPYNMAIFLYTSLDLMCSLKFNIQEFGTMREVIWRAQKMTRIGNWVSTWEREIKDNDFSNAIISYAIESKIVTVDELKQVNKLEIIKKIKNAKIERELLKEWEQCYHEIEALSKKAKISHIQKLLLSLEKIIVFHLTSRGYK